MILISGISWFLISTSDIWSQFDTRPASSKKYDKYVNATVPAYAKQTTDGVPAKAKQAGVPAKARPRQAATLQALSCETIANALLLL